MFETTRFESRQRLPASIVIAVGLAAFAAMVVMIAPGILEEIDIDQLLEVLPPALIETFRLEAMGTLEGFLALEIYQFVWLIGLGAYLAYAAAGTIVGDIETSRMDTLLAAPISRTGLLIEKFLALLTPIVIVNAVIFSVIYIGSRLIQDPIALERMVAVHVLSVPYLLCCAAVGMIASVFVVRRIVAEGIGAGAIIGLFLLQAVVTPTDFDWVARLTPMYYYDPLTILTAGEYDLVGTAVLLGATGVLLGGSVLRFRRLDIA